MSNNDPMTRLTTAQLAQAIPTVVPNSPIAVKQLVIGSVLMSLTAATQFVLTVLPGILHSNPANLLPPAVLGGITTAVTGFSAYLLKLAHKNHTIAVSDALLADPKVVAVISQSTSRANKL